MSTEYKPFLGVGLVFEWKEFKAFLEYYSLTEGIDIEYDDLEDVAKHCGVHIETLDGGDEFFVGWKTESESITGLSDLLVGTQVRWEARFPAHEPELVHLVTSF